MPLVLPDEQAGLPERRGVSWPESQVENTLIETSQWEADLQVRGPGRGDRGPTAKQPGLAVTWEGGQWLGALPKGQYGI